MIRRMKHLSYDNRTRKLELFSMEKRKLLGRPYCSLTLPNGTYSNMVRGFLLGPVAIGQGITALN